jgi:DNA-binding CsgD family transcriptional regulator
MISLRDFSELLQVLYAAPLYQGHWDLFLTRLCDHTGARSGFLLCANSHSELTVQAQGGVPFDSSILDAYAADYAPSDPFRLPMLRHGKTGFLDCEALVPTETLLQSEMYRHIHQPAGYRYPSLILLTCSVRRLEAISFWRTPAEGPMDDDSQHLLELLVPHIQSSLEIHHVLGVAQTRVTGATVMADASPTAALLLTPQGRIHHCNAAAASMLRDGDGLVEINGTLRAAAINAREPLRSLLKRVAEPGFSISTYLPAQALSLDRTSRLRPLQLLASPVPPMRGGNTDPTLLLLVTDPEKPVHLRDDLMRAHYGLTPAETEVANGLLTGYSLEEIAVLRRVTVSTIRDQLKNIFGKTGTNRQADLVRLLLNLPHAPSGHA